MFHPARTLSCSALAATLLALAPGSAHADDGFFVQKALHVGVSDLDARSPADAATPCGRSRAAGRQVCDHGTSIDRDCALHAAIRL